MKIRRYANQESLILLICVLSIVAVYWHDLAVLLDDALRNEMASYILALPFLVVYMAYRNRNLLKAQLSHEIERSQIIPSKDVIGTALCLSAMFLYVYGSFTFNVLEYHIASLIVFIFGCSVLLLGIQNLKNMFFPLGLLLLLIIPYREEAYQASGYLSILTSTITFNLLKLLAYPVSLTSIYDTPSIMIQTSSTQQVPFVIDIPCAGAYSLIGFLVFALFFAYISGGSQPRKLAWLLLGFSFIYAANIVRVSSILAVGYWFGVETAMGLFHLLSGSVLIFLASLLMILVGEKYLKIGLFRKKEVSENSCPLCQENKARNHPFCNYCGRFFNPSDVSMSRIDLGKILALSFLAAILVSAQVPAFSLAQQNVMELDIHELTGSKEAQQFLPVFEEYEPKFLYRDQRFERIAQQDASLLYVYRAQNSTTAPILVSVEIADSYSKLHRWEICLVVSEERPIANPIVSKDVHILENPPLVGRLFVFKYVSSGQTVMILYWYDKAAFRIGDGWGNRYVKTSVIAYLDSFVKTGEIPSVAEKAGVESRLMSMAQGIINYWQPVKEWSAYIVVFAQYGQILSIAIPLGSSFLVAILQLKKDRDERNQAYSTYRQLVWHSTLSKREKEILKVLKILDRKEGATGIELARTYEEETGKKVDPRDLAEIIRHTEDHGLIVKKIVERDEEPVLTWELAITLNI